MKNKIFLLTLLFFFVYGVCTTWTPILKLIVILNSIIVLLQVLLYLKEVLAHGRK